MHLFATIRRILEAFATALGVVFGLMPDPTLVPVERERDLLRRRQ